MSVIRLRRLTSDYEKVSKFFYGNPYVKVKVLEGNPPYKYMVTYNLKGLEPGSPSPKTRETHEVEIYLSQDYPRETPVCKMKTPHFHPNIYASNDEICLGIWVPGEGLVNLIVWIGMLIQYQSYNLNSPANSTAKDWAQVNKSKFPIDNKNVGKLTEKNIRLLSTGNEKEKIDCDIILY
jgi:ubiquitin-protein ligase